MTEKITEDTRPVDQENGQMVLDVCDVDAISMMENLKRQFEDERVLMKEQFTEEKAKLETEIREYYEEAIKDKDILIQDLMKEKDALLHELQETRKSDELDNNCGESSVSYTLSNDHLEQISGPKPISYRTKPVYVEEQIELYTSPEEIWKVMRMQKENLLLGFSRETAEMEKKFGREKLLLSKKIKDECERQYLKEKVYLIETIQGLKDALLDLRRQKHELAKIFEGEKNAIELKFKREEKQLKDEMKKELQRKLVHAHKIWETTQI